MTYRQLITLSAMAVVAIALVAAPAIAKRGVEIGEEAPAFELPGTDGEVHKLADHEDSIVVLHFCSEACPWSHGATPEIDKIAEKYSEKGVVFYGIDSGKNNEMDDLIKYTEDLELDFVTLKDKDNIYADALDAKQTPEFFIIGKDGKLAYHGAFDNRVSPAEAGEKNYVTAALDALLAGKDVDEPEVSAWGCSIKRAKRPAR